jgi:hypothetical protein
MREALNARGCALPSSKQLLDLYLCSDGSGALTLALLLQRQLALLIRVLEIWQVQRSCGLPFARLCGVACLWQRDELFRAQ